MPGSATIAVGNGAAGHTMPGDRPLHTWLRPPASHTIRAVQADLIDIPPGVHLPDVAELHARGVIGGLQATSSSLQRCLGADGRADEERPV